MSQRDVQQVNVPTQYPPPVLGNEQVALDSPISQPYEVLWALAEYYLKTATTLVAANYPEKEETTTSIYTHVVAAVRCLEAVLVSGVLPLKVEVKTRYRLAQILLVHTFNLPEADTHLQKAILLIQKTSDEQMLEFRFIIKDLQCEIYQADPSGSGGKTVKNVLKQAAADALRLGMPRWYYHFIQRRAELHAREGDIKLCFSVLMSGAEEAGKRGDVDMKAVLLLFLAHHTLMARQDMLTQDAISQLQQLFEPQVPAGIDHSNDASMSPVTDNGTALVSHGHLRLYYSLILIIHLIHLGKAKDALNRLTALHALVEHPSMSANVEIDKGLAIVTVRKGDKFDTVPVTLHSRNKLYALVFLVSGIAHKLNDNFKAKKHFLEGIKTIEKELGNISTEIGSVQEMVEARQWLAETKVVLLRHFAEVGIVRGEFCDVFRFMTKLVEWCSADAVLWRKYQPIVSLDWGMFYQAIGQYAKAEWWLKTAAEGNDANVRHIAKIHLILLYFTETIGDRSMGAAMLEDLDREQESGQSLSDGQRALLGTVRGVSHMINKDIRQTKLHLLESIKICETLSCTQLRFINVALLGELFSNVDSMQAEKMVATAHIMAKKSHCESFALVCARVLIEIYQRRGDKEKEDKYRTMAEGHKEKVEKAYMDVWKMVEDAERASAASTVTSQAT
ncbi:hypothetical protein SpCBS45565_g02274 [Spizellomyces sp. 'palustris']|nr:hypothetical protein SpCBS45565_g02274 [Spizellomyces sp. 'palustris']